MVLCCGAVLMLAGCATHHTRRPAPIVEQGVEMRKPASAGVASPVLIKRPITTTVATQVYIVQKGDTLYGIAFLHGVDYREVAELNGIDNPSAIQIGQSLRIPLVSVEKSVEPKAQVTHALPTPGGLKTQPKATKVPYSAAALGQAEKSQDEVKAEISTAPIKTETVASKEDDEDVVEWGMPSSGKVVAGFSESANRKGVDIAGKQGQAVVASAAGKVVYSGSGLRGYGKLVIIKHNKTFLSAYAHNDQVLVKEGQSVSKGQKIAEMGNTDADQVKLHFEIRKFGKPVDPAQYLPLIKS